MDKWCSNRLTVLGSKRQVQQFVKRNWERRLHARHGELMENSPRRFVCLFETDEPPLEPLRALSGRIRQGTFLLDYEIESERSKGLVRIRKGQIQHCQFSY